MTFYLYYCFKFLISLKVYKKKRMQNENYIKNQDIHLYCQLSYQQLDDSKYCFSNTPINELCLFPNE